MGNILNFISVTLFRCEKIRGKISLEEASSRFKIFEPILRVGPPPVMSITNPGARSKEIGVVQHVF